MNTLLLLQQYQLTNLYNTLSFHKTKEKNHMVLEPLQAMINLALLSVCNIGTKLTIQENTLNLQIPSLFQPFNRWYNADKKDDLYFLFPVIKNYIKWYNPLNKSSKSPIRKELYDLIIKMVIKGLKNLIKTYQFINNITVIHVINIYIELLQSNDIKDIDKSIKDENINIDEIFEKIITIYEVKLLNIIENTLLILETEDNDNVINNYINGLNLIMKNQNKLIQTWIQSKLII